MARIYSGPEVVSAFQEAERELGLLWMFGLPCSGKSTLSRAMPSRLRVGIDDVREKMGHTIDDDPRPSYQRAYRRMQDGLRRGRPVTFDSSGWWSVSRAWGERQARRHAVPWDALVVCTPVDIARERAAERYGTPNPFFERMVRWFEYDLEDALREAGFDRIFLVGPTEAEMLLGGW